MSDLLRLLTKKEQCEQIAQVAHQKWATMSYLLRLLTKNEQMSKSLFFSKLLIRLLFADFSQKTSDSLRKPMSEFTTLPKITFQFSVRYGLTEICFVSDLVLALKDEKQ